MKRYKVKEIESSTSEYDLADELTRMLSEHIAKEIDKGILSSLGLEDRKTKRINKVKKIF